MGKRMWNPQQLAKSSQNTFHDFFGSAFLWVLPVVPNSIMVWLYSSSVYYVYASTNVMVSQRKGFALFISELSPREGMPRSKHCLLAQTVKILLQFGQCGFNPCVRKIPWRRKWQPSPVFLPGEFHGQRSLAGYIQFLGSQRARHYHATNTN